MTDGRKGRAAADTLGVYVHVPFCEGGKCPYCDFYSVTADEAREKAYTQAAKRSLAAFAAQTGGRTVDTVYFGGGTPTTLGGPALAELLRAVRQNFAVAPDAEITAEANPGGVSGALFSELREAGFNRLSMGLQSANAEELSALGRRHSPQEAEAAVRLAQKAGFTNLSLDLMLAIPGQTAESLSHSVVFAASLGVPHVSAYLLKIEPGTPFYRQRQNLRLADDDAAAALYETACAQLEKAGYTQYEISNFAKPGFASRHNLRYWRCEEYVGAGPGAHSFLNGRRFFYERGLDAFVGGAGTTPDGEGGGYEERVMLGLRLAEGISGAALAARCGAGLEKLNAPAVSACERAGLLVREGDCLRLTRSGFLVSNAVIGRLLS